MLSPGVEVLKPFTFRVLEEPGPPFPPSLHTREARERMMKW
jgi:hypothetical protein